MLFRSNTLVGRKGNDQLYGFFGNDKYIWNIGDGNDVIYDGVSSMGSDVLCFGKGITLDSVCVEWDTHNLYFVIGEERITVWHWGLEDHYQNAFSARFWDGTEWNGRKIQELVKQIVGTDSDDTLGYPEMPGSVLNGKKGNDILQGGEFEDTYIWDVGDGNELRDRKSVV